MPPFSREGPWHACGAANNWVRLENGACLWGAGCFREKAAGDGHGGVEREQNREVLLESPRRVLGRHSEAFLPGHQRASWRRCSFLIRSEDQTLISAGAGLCLRGLSRPLRPALRFWVSRDLCSDSQLPCADSSHL